VTLLLLLLLRCSTSTYVQSCQCMYQPSNEQNISHPILQTRISQSSQLPRASRASLLKLSKLLLQHLGNDIQVRALAARRADIVR
jgi:hypothetical protein